MTDGGEGVPCYPGTLAYRKSFAVMQKERNYGKEEIKSTWSVAEEDVSTGRGQVRY
jgi:hypothetical protein